MASWDEDDVINVEQAAQLLHVGETAIRRQLLTGKMPGRKIGKEWRLSRTALREWISTPTNPADLDDEDIDELDP